MDKSLETYEFVPVNAEAGSDQFFVVQDDGTFLINRQVQYVTEVQDVKTVLDGVPSCTVYDVTEQPFFVDVDNSSELMSVSDQFVLPGASSNLYANSYLLHTGTSTNQVQEDITRDQFRTNPSMGIELEVDNKSINNCTEITLNDEQYQKLEQKGWLLIELKDKVFVLDTLGGLRDITSNNKLIQKLKSEDQADVIWDKGLQSVKVENRLSPLEQTLSPQPNSMEYVITNATAQNDLNIEHSPLAVRDQSKEEPTAQDTAFVHREMDAVNSIDSNATNSINTTSSLPQNADPCKDVNVFLVKSEKDDEHTAKEKTVIRIKTKLSLKDIPDRIVLGKTPTGKTLVARVKKTEVPQEEKALPNIPNDNSLNESVDATFDPDEMRFPDLIKRAIQIPEQHITPKDLQTIDMIIAQLIQAEPPYHASIQIDDYLFITKIVEKENDNGMISKCNPSIWTGCVKAIDNQSRFVHLPNILQNLLFSDDCATSATTVIHIHILDEVRQGTNIVKTSVTVHKKQIMPGRPKKMDTVYACSACATIFDTEEELKEHRGACLETMATSDTSNPLAIDRTRSIRCIQKGKRKYYECLQCFFKFNRLNTCKSHMRIHYQQTNKDSNNDDAKTKGKYISNEVYKCNMCSSVYLHASTLTKHIVSRHIRVVTYENNN